MKKLYALLPLLAALLAPGEASAQMMPDSTVQIVAYWEVGDQLDYLVLEEQYEMDGDKETMTRSASETVRYEVIAATDSTYTLQVTSLDGFSSNLNIPEKDLAALPDFPFRIRMSQLGEFLELENTDEILNSLEKAVPVFTKLTLNGLTPEERKSVDKKGLDEYYRQALVSRAFVDNMCQQYIAPFFYHGARMDTTMTYSFKNTYTGIFGDDAIELETLFSVDSELTDDYSAVIRRETVADNVDLIPLLKGFVPLVENLDKNASREELEQSLRELQINANFEEYVAEEIVLESGWPTIWVFDRFVTAGQGDETKGTHVYKKFQVVTEEE